MRKVKIGDILIDNDARMANRRMIVIKVDKAKATCRLLACSKVTRISLGRIFTDGKPRRYGLSLEE